MTTASAIALVDRFAASGKGGMWTGISVGTLVADLKARLGNPNSVHQQQTPFCGPASFIRALILDQPDAYAQAAIDLYTTGECTIGTLKIKPYSAVWMSAPQNGTSAADWLMLAGLKDSENLWFSGGGLFGGNLAGITIPGTLAGWFTAAGYGTVINNASVTKIAPAARTVQLVTANTYRSSGHYVVMLIDSDLLSEINQNDESSGYPDHWVTLTTAITAGGTLEDPISMSVFSWGGIYTIPRNAAKPLKKKYFLNKFYGYLAVKM